MLPVPKACISLFSRWGAWAVWRLRGGKLKNTCAAVACHLNAAKLFSAGQCCRQRQKARTVYLHGHASAKREALLSTPNAWRQVGIKTPGTAVGLVQLGNGIIRCLCRFRCRFTLLLQRHVLIWCCGALRFAREMIRYGLMLPLPHFCFFFSRNSKRKKIQRLERK